MNIIMVKCILIKKGGTIKCSNLKLSSLNEIYKKCGFMNNNYFDSRNIWSLDNKSFYTIYSKNKGKAGSENKYDLPPPIDSELYFGTMVILKHSKENIDINNLQDLTLDEWQNVYDTLFGGFEDLDDDEESSEEEDIDPDDLTKEGYLKDDFVVDDDSIDDIESVDDSVEDVDSVDDSIEDIDSEFEDISDEEDDGDDYEEDEEDDDDDDDDDEYDDDEDEGCLTEESIDEDDDDEDDDSD